MELRRDEQLKKIRERSPGSHAALCLTALPSGSAQRPPFRPSRLRRYGDLLLAKAQALIERGTIEILTNGEPLHAQLHVFADTTGVFEYELRAPYGDSGGMSRIDKDTLTPARIAACLQHALSNSQVRPVAGQEI